jgi:hypothetical protein
MKEDIQLGFELVLGRPEGQDGVIKVVFPDDATESEGTVKELLEIFRHDTKLVEIAFDKTKTKIVRMGFRSFSVSDSGEFRPATIFMPCDFSLDNIKQQAEQMEEAA